MAGKEVDQATKGNLCTAASHDSCQAGVQSALASDEAGAFDFEEGYDGDLLAADSALGLLYVASGHGVQELDANGAWKGQIELPSVITSPEPEGYVSEVAADANAAYVVYNRENTVYEFDPGTGVESGAKIVIPSKDFIRGIALDDAGHIAIEAHEDNSTGIIERMQLGWLFEASTGRIVTTFTVPGQDGSASTVNGIGFVGETLYVPFPGMHEVVGYVPEPVAEVVTGRTTCKAGAVVGTSDTFDCELGGEVNPYGIEQTEVWFEWSESCSVVEQGTPHETAHQAVPTVSTPVHVGVMLEGLRPGAPICFRLDGSDKNVSLPERFTGEADAVLNPTAPPRVVGAPTTSFVSAFSAVMFGELDPENTPTEYFFEYAPEYSLGEDTLAKCAGITKTTGCPGVSSTEVLQSELYGTATTMLEASDLRPETVYGYRLTARREGAEAALLSGAEERFVTGSAPQAEREPGAPTEVAQSEFPVAFAAPAPSMLLATPAVEIPVTDTPAPGPKCSRGYSRSKAGQCVKPKKKKVKGRARRQLRSKHK